MRRRRIAALLALLGNELPAPDAVDHEAVGAALGTTAGEVRRLLRDVREQRARVAVGPATQEQV